MPLLSTHKDIVDAVRAAGEHEFDTAGVQWYPDLFITTMLTVPRRAAWDDRDQARLRMHLLLLSEKGWMKSSTSKTWLRNYAGAIPLPETEMDEPRPVYLDLAGRGIKWERLRGSATQAGTIVPPLLPLANYYYASEFQSFLGHRAQERSEMMDSLNEMMEEGMVNVALIKMTQKSLKKSEEVAEELKRLGVIFNPLTNFMSYRVRGSLIACTRPFTQKVEEEFAHSGLLSRFHISQWKPGNEGYADAWEKGPGDVSPLREEVAAFCALAWTLRVKKVNYPPADLRKIVMAAYKRAYVRIEGELGIPVHETRTMRDHVNGAQLITARAIMRYVTEHQDEQILPPLDVLRYDESDALWAARFIDAKKGGEYEDWVLKYKTDKEEKSASELLRDFNAVHRGEEFTRGQLKRYLMDVRGMTQPTAYRRISSMRASNLIIFLRDDVFAYGWQMKELLGVNKEEEDEDDNGSEEDE